MAGRKFKLNKDIIQSLANSINNGATDGDACYIASISKASFYQWLDMAESIRDEVKGKKVPRDPKQRALLLELLDTIKKSRSKNNVHAVSEIRRSGAPYWKHIKTGKILYTPPGPKTWIHKVTGEIQFAAPEQMEMRSFDEEWSGQTWEYNKGQWQAYAWYLERSDPNNWGRKQIMGVVQPKSDEGDQRDADPDRMIVFLPDDGSINEEQ